MNTPFLRLEKHIAITDNLNTTNEINAVDHLNQNSTLSKQQIKRAMSKGAVWLTRGNQTQRLRRAKKPLQNGDTLHLYYNNKILDEEPPRPTLIKDEKSYSIWYKPYGMYSQGSKWGDHCAINRWVEQHMQRPTFIVHRLDRATTGLILMAHEKKSTAALAQLFQLRRLEKRYRAIVHGQFSNAKETRTIDDSIDGRSAISHATCLAYFEQSNQSLVEVHIETGRKHQIRKHLASTGHPVVGDRLYSQKNDHHVDLQLCSCYLAFTCPIQQKEKHFDLLKTDLPHIHIYQM